MSKLEECYSEYTIHTNTGMSQAYELFLKL